MLLTSYWFILCHCAELNYNRNNATSEASVIISVILRVITAEFYLKQLYYKLIICRTTDKKYRVEL